MTYYQHKCNYFQTVFSELEFLYYEELCDHINSGKKWYTFPKMKEHGQRFKQKLLQHVYNKRRWDLSDLSY